MLVVNAELMSVNWKEQKVLVSIKLQIRYSMATELTGNNIQLGKNVLFHPPKISKTFFFASHHHYRHRKQHLHCHYKHTPSLSSFFAHSFSNLPTTKKERKKNKQISIQWFLEIDSSFVPLPSSSSPFPKYNIHFDILSYSYHTGLFTRTLLPHCIVHEHYSHSNICQIKRSKKTTKILTIGKLQPIF